MKNKFQLIRIGLLGTALVAVIVTNNLLPKTAYADGDLTIDWGVSSGDPIFVVNNMVPGQCETRTVNVTNSAVFNRQVGVRGMPTVDTDNLSSALEITIDKNGTTDVYGEGSPTGVKTLATFFSESAGANALTLSNQTPGEIADYNFTVCFQESAGNEFQNTSVVFDLIIGIVIPTPDECLEMAFANTMFGTDGNDRIRGTSAPELIFGLEGNDRIDGGGGNDCIVGGAGNDKLEGGSGNDRLDGGIGEDKLEGGSGNDGLRGGDQNDVLEGGSGQDQLFGEAGNDNLKGGSDNDFLDGGADGGTLNGDSGIDRCINGAPKIKCEILI